jgi:uncharacterized phage protein (TIGR02218 family)
MSVLAMERTADLAPDHATVETAAEGQLDLNDVLTGKLRGAEAELWKIDAENPAARLLLLAGTVGEIEREGDRLSIELRSTAEKLGASTGRVYGRSCDARLGDPRCGVDLTAPNRREAASVTKSGLLTIELSGLMQLSADQLADGRLHFTSGDLVGTERPIRTARAVPGGAAVTLWEALPREPQAGDSAMLTIGCDKSFATCHARFANAQNFRGFPHIPGLAALAVQRGAG